jgi:O-antigen ligase
MSRIALATSHVAFALSFLLAMLTPTWREGAFARLQLLAFQVSGQRFRIGALALFPPIAAGAWVAGRLLNRPTSRKKHWHWGPAYLALPVLGLGALILARVWPIHIRHTAAVTAAAIVIFWFAYFYGLSEWPEEWATTSLAALLALQGTIGALQFVKQGSIGLSCMGERWLDPELGEGMSVIAVTGRRYLRAYGLTPHPNALGGYLSMSWLVCLGALIRSSTRSKTRAPVWWIGLCLALGGVGLLLTFSRSAWLGTSAGLIYWAAVTRPWRHLNWQSTRTRRTAMVVGALVLVATIAILLALGDLLVTRFFRLSDPLERQSLDDRIHDIREAWSLIRVVPLKGTGSGYYVSALWARVGHDRPPGFRHVHNVPLLAAAELGIPGALLWLWMLLAPPITQALRARREGTQDTTPLAMRAGWAAAFLSAFFLSMLDSYLYITSFWWAALYLGVLAGQWAQSETRARVRRENL